MDSSGGGSVIGNIIAVFNGITFAGISIFLRLQKDGDPALSMYFGNANPIIAALACLIFGACEALGARVQLVGIPSQFVLMLPYIITVVVLVIAMASAARKERRLKSAKRYITVGR